MASVSNLTLDIEVVNDGANLVANVTASYRINWSSYDQNSNQPYRESCVLIGDDTGITPAEDGTDDSDPQRHAVPAAAVPAVPGRLRRAGVAADPAVQHHGVRTASRSPTASTPRRST